MLRWFALAVVAVGIVLYFYGALELSNGSDSVDISIDKEKTKELGESIKDKIEE